MFIEHIKEGAGKIGYVSYVPENRQANPKPTYPALLLPALLLTGRTETTSARQNFVFLSTPQARNKEIPLQPCSDS